MKKNSLTIAALLMGTAISSGALAVVPELIPLQGILTDDVGEPITDVVVMTFRMYDSEGASSAIWTEAQSVTVDNGFFTIYMGDVTALPSDFPTYSEVWLGVTVDSDPEMDRFQLGAVPYALEAQRCEQVGSLTEDDINTSFAPASAGVPSGAVMFFNLSSCPSGWSPLTAAEGRMLQGLPSAGTLAGTYGTPLGNTSPHEITQVPQHTHSIDPASQSVTVNTVSSHNHDVNPASFTSGSGGGHSHTMNTNGNHNHDLRTEYAGGYGTYGVMGTTDNAGGNITTGPIYSAGDHTHSINSASSHTHSIDVPNTTSNSNGSHTHTASFDMSAFDTAETGASTVDVTMPYIQLLVCVKD